MTLIDLVTLAFMAVSKPLATSSAENPYLWVMRGSQLMAPCSSSDKHRGYVLVYLHSEEQPPRLRANQEGQQGAAAVPVPQDFDYGQTQCKCVCTSTIHVSLMGCSPTTLLGTAV